jgi:hypothetical protein
MTTRIHICSSAFVSWINISWVEIYIYIHVSTWNHYAVHWRILHHSYSVCCCAGLAAVRVYAGDWTASCGFHHFFPPFAFRGSKVERKGRDSCWMGRWWICTETTSKYKPISNILGVVNVCYIRVTYAGQPRYYPVLAQHHRVSTIKQLAHLNSQPLYMCVCCAGRSR